MELTTRNQQFAALSAVIYLTAGVLGFFVTGFDDFAADTDEKLIILGLNPLHNVVHLVLGAAWLVAARDAATARMANIALGAGLLVAHAPRAMLDLNRATDDVDWDMIANSKPDGVRHSLANRRARSGLGLVPRRLPGGRRCPTGPSARS